MRTITYRDALREAIREEMRRDERVYILGEDIAEVDFCEVPADRLVEALRAARGVGPAEGERHTRQEKSAAGVVRAHGGFTWDRATDVVKQCVGELCQRGQRR